MKKIIRIILLSLLCISQANISYGQGRNWIKEKIQQHGNCRNVAITRTGGDVMLYGRNGWAANGCPTGLTNSLNELNERNEYIDDIQLTEGNRWLILYGNNGFLWNDIPYSLERKLREYNNNDEVVLSVTFNDDGDWIIITKDHYSASDQRIVDFLQEGARMYGMLWSACITDDALVAVYENGYNTIGNVPITLKNALRNTNINIFRLKIAGTAWFFADNDGHFNYYM